MKALALTILSLLIICAFSQADSGAETINFTKKLIAANNDFGFRVLSQLTKDLPKQNLLISPMSIAMCLNMVYNGADGETKSAMAKTLGIEDFSLEQLNSANAELLTKLKSSDSKIVVNIANSIWGHKTVKFKQTFINQNKKYYSAEVVSLDFYNPKSVLKINKWVAAQTNNKITKIVEALDPSQLIILINAVYFKGSWSLAFDKSKTKELPFTLIDNTQIKIPMMTQTGSYFYYEDASLQVIKLPYGKGKMNMYLFLPKDNLVDFLSAFDSKQWLEYQSQFQYQKGSITLPRFKFEYGKTLNDILIALGMQIAFTEADFINMCDQLVFISDVLHKTYIEVNEQGTEAAAVTATFMATAVLEEPKPFTMVVDRPFFFVICDDETNAILFMGAVTNPS
ncbi:MAG: serpin family protein [candidate division WOR-3 bacterium]